jgi:signal transduction histidine kinase
VSRASALGGARRPGQRGGLVWRVFASYLVVVGVATVGALVAGEALAPYLIERHMRTMGPMPSSEPMMAMVDDLAAAYRSALTQALAWAALVATAVAVVVAWSVTSRLLAPLRALRAASRSIAAGRYDARLDAGAPSELGELAGSFNTMAGALEQNEVIRQQLLGDLSHELRTPLSNLRGYLEALEDGVLALDAATSAALRRQVERMERLVNDLSLLHRLEAGQVAVAPTAVDLSALIADSLSAFRARFEERGIAVSTVEEEADAIVHADAARSGQVLENLLANALRHTPPGGRVVVATRASGAALRVEVGDSGPGVPPEQREAVFRRLFRGDPARSSSHGEGSGIGLTIAKALVLRQGGEIGVEEAEGGGACFFFTLPRARSARP